jgi:hypothetical protein
MPQLVLHDGGGRRKHHVRRGRGDDDQVDVGRLQARRLQRRLREAGTARSLAGTSGSAKWRARMPVRSTIHSSDVSMPRAPSSAPDRRWSRGAAAGSCRCR